MDPYGFAKNKSEDAEQTALFCWVRMAISFGVAVADSKEAYEIKGWAAEHKDSPVDILGLLFAIPNGGARDPKVGAILKATGVKPGVSDIFFPAPLHGLHGLWIEMKKAKGGTESLEQKWWGAQMQEQGYGYVVCHGWIEARAIILQWLGIDDHLVGM